EEPALMILPSALAQMVPPEISTVRLLSAVASPVRVRMPLATLTPGVWAAGAGVGAGVVLPLLSDDRVMVSEDVALGNAEFAPPWSLLEPEPPMIVSKPEPAVRVSLP